MFRRWITLVILLMLSLSLVAVTPARAQDSVTFNFVEGSWGWQTDEYNADQIKKGVQVNGQGWRQENLVPYPYFELGIMYEFPQAVTIEEVQITYSMPSTGNASMYLYLQSTNESPHNYINYEYATGWSNLGGMSYQTVTTIGQPGDISGTPLTTLLVRLSSTDNASSANGFIHSITILYDDGIDEENWVRPLAAEDEHPQWELFDYQRVHDLDPDWDIPENNTVYAFSSQFGAPVHAAVEGEIVSVERLTYADCAATQIIPQGDCLVFIPPAITDDGDLHIYRLNLTDAPIYMVQLRVNTDVIMYIVADADQYVEAGTTVREGCILGKTIQLQHLLDSEMTGYGLDVGFQGLNISVDFEYRSILTNHGVAMMIYGDPETGQTFPLLQYLTLESSLFQACNENPAYVSCYGDPELRRPDEWTETGLVAWNNPGVTLSTNLSRISRVLPLEEGGEYSMTVNATQTGQGNGKIRLHLGGTVVETTITAGVGNTARYVIDSDTHEPDYAGMYTVSITNAGTAPFRVTSICVTDGAPNPTQNSCYFYNPSFDNGNTGWDLSGGIQNWGGGDIRVPDQDTFAQTVHLYPDDGTTYYRVSAKASLWTIPGYAPSTSNWEDTVTLEYQWPGAASWVPIPSPSSVTSASFAQFAYDPTLEFSWVFHVSSETNGTWTFRPTIDSEDANVLGVTIYEVCVQYSGGTFPGFTYDDDPYNPTCAYIGPPAGNTIGDWISWHWAHLNRFFSCELMILLNNIYELLQQFMDMVGWAIRYMIALANQGGNWVGSDLIPWFGGHFYNMAVGQTTYIVNEGGECNNIFCFFSNLFGTGGSIFHDLTTTLTSLFHDLTDSIDNLINGLGSLLGQIISQIIAPIVDTILGIINQVVGVLLVIILQIVQVAFTLLSMVFNVFNQMLHMAQVILSAWQNATPTAIPGLPTCAIDPKSNALCAGLYLLEHTVFSGPGQLLIPILIGYGTIMMLLWAVGELKKEISETGKSL